MCIDMIKGRLYLTTAFVLAGSSVVAASFISGYIPPFTTTFFSLVFASLTALLVCGRKMYHIGKRLSKRTWLAISLQALFGSFLFRAFLTLGLQHIGSAEAGIITGATPAITAVLTWVMLRENPNIRIITGIFLTFAGILMVQGFPFELSLDKLQPLGTILVLCSAVSESLFTTLSRKIHTGEQDEEPLPPVVHAGYVSFIAMALCLIPTLIERPWAKLIALPVSGWLALAWYGSVVTIVAFACMFAGAKRCDGYTIAAYAGIIPVSAAALSVILLHETINAYQIAGCAMVVFATAVISKRKKTK